MSASSRGVTLRAEVPDDREAIREVVYAAFLNETHRQPGAQPTEHLIIDALREAGALTISLVAEQEGRVVGHIAFSPVRIDGVSAGGTARPDCSRTEPAEGSEPR